MVGVVCLTMRPMPIKCQAEVRDLEVPGSADQEVVWLDIPMDPVHLVRFVNAKYHLCHILPGDRFIENVFSQE